MQRSYLVSLFMMIGLFYTQYIYSAADRYTSENTFIAWDFDDVIANKPGKLGTAGTMASAIFTHPVEAWYAFSAWRNAPASPASHIELIGMLKQDSPDIATAIEHVSHNKTPIHGSILLIHDLNVLHFQQAIATNMNSEDFDYFKKLPQFSFLSDCFGYTQSVSPNERGERIKKSNPAYFERFFRNLPESYRGKEFMIFIDDKQSNINVANDVAERYHVTAIGIIFKNPEQLHAELVNMGILPAEAPSATIAH